MKEEIEKKFPDKSVTIEYMILDLGSFRSTKDFTVAFKERNLPLHVLINNGGISLMSAPLGEFKGHLLRSKIFAAHTVDGHEMQFQVNHLGHMLLTLELLPIIRDTARSTGDGRIVFVSSLAEGWGKFEPDNLDGQRSYSALQLYNNAKLFNVLKHTVDQDRVNNMLCFIIAANDRICTAEKAKE